MTVNKSSSRVKEGEKTTEEAVPEWRRRMERSGRIRYITHLGQIPEISSEELGELESVAQVFEFRANSYYLSLIDWVDPNDPIRRIVIPSPEELEDEGLLDASLEHKITVAPGCEHKYTRTALILLSRVCGSICRFCFRKRIFLKDNREITPKLEPAYQYIRSHREVDNVLVTGGDPLILSTKKLAEVLETLRSIPHVRIIRIGSKLTAFNPYRILDDPELVTLLRKHSLPDARIYIVAQFNHPRELTEVATEAVRLLQRNGLLYVNQTPLLVGINDDPDTLAELLTRLAQVGVPPYYVFQCRPTRGNAHFKIPMVRAHDIMEAAKKQVSGLGKRARFAGSHASGKIEILGYDREWQYFKYHQAKNPDEYGRFFKLPRNDEATWWDDWMPNGESFTLSDCPVVEIGSGSG